MSTTQTTEAPYTFSDACRDAHTYEQAVLAVIRSHGIDEDTMQSLWRLWDYPDDPMMRTYGRLTSAVMTVLRAYSIGRGADARRMCDEASLALQERLRAEVPTWRSWIDWSEQVHHTHYVGPAAVKAVRIERSR